MTGVQLLQNAVESSHKAHGCRRVSYRARSRQIEKNLKYVLTFLQSIFIFLKYQTYMVQLFSNTILCTELPIGYLTRLIILHWTTWRLTPPILFQLLCSLKYILFWL